MIRSWLNKQTKYVANKTGIDISYFVGGGIWLSFPTIVNYAMGLLRSVAFARLIAQKTYGQFGFINSAFGVISLLSLPGINTALVETVARGNYGSLGQAAKARARWGLLGSVLLIFVAFGYWRKGQVEMGEAFIVAAIFLPLNAALQVGVAYYNGQKEFRVVSLLKTVQSVGVTASLMVALYFGLTLFWIVLANFGTITLINSFFFLKAWFLSRGAPVDNDVVSYGRSLTFANAISVLAFELDNLILGAIGGYVNLAIYNVAMVLPESIKRFMKMLSPLVLPKIAEKPKKRVYQRSTRRKLFYLLCINLSIVIVGVVSLPIVIPLLYSSDYQGSVFYAQLLMLSLAVGMPSNFFSAALQARKQTRAIYRFNVVYGVIQVVTLVTLVPKWGLMGVVVSRIVTRFAGTAYQWYAVSKI